MAEDREIIAVRTGIVAGHEHITAVKLADGSIEDAGRVIRAIQNHDAHYVMTPPPGAPAYEAWLQHQAPLLVQVGLCPDCNERQLVA